MNIIAKNWLQLISIMNSELFKLEGVSITAWSIVQLCVLSAVLIFCAPKLNATLLKKVFSKYTIKPEMRKTFIRASRGLVFLIGFLLIFHLIGIDAWIFKQLQFVYTAVQGVVDLKLFKLGNTQLTLLTVIYVLVFSFLLVRFTTQLHNLLLARYLSKTKMDIGMQRAIGTSFHYGLLFLGFVILLQTAGIDLSAMTVMMGALGIGVSFGLQNITNNLISGLIILFERPIKIGDQVQIGDITGEVRNISLRATTVVTKENVAVFVPNSQFITSNVINWSFNGRSVGLRFTIVVAYSGDPEMIKDILLEVAEHNPAVLKTPAPTMTLEELAKDSVKFSAHVWTQDFTVLPDALRSEMNFEIARRLRKPVEMPAQNAQSA